MLRNIVAALVLITPVIAQAASVEDGRQDYLVYCAPCHGIGGTGDGPVSLELTKKPIDLTSLSREYDDDRIKMIVDGRSMPRAHGAPEMPVWGRWFSYQATAGGLLQEDRQTIEKEVNQRLNNLVAYIKTIQK